MNMPRPFSSCLLWTFHWSPRHIQLCCSRKGSLVLSESALLWSPRHVVFMGNRREGGKVYFFQYQILLCPKSWVTEKAKSLSGGCLHCCNWHLVSQGTSLVACLFLSFLGWDEQCAITTYFYCFQLCILDLGKDQIQIVKDRNFLSYCSLKHLSLHANGLQSLPSRLLSALAQLQRLTLSKNKLGPEGFQCASSAAPAGGRSVPQQTLGSSPFSLNSRSSGWVVTIIPTYPTRTWRDWGLLSIIALFGGLVRSLQWVYKDPFLFLENLTLQPSHMLLHPDDTVHPASPHFERLHPLHLL